MLQLLCVVGRALTFCVYPIAETSQAMANPATVALLDAMRTSALHEKRQIGYSVVSVDPFMYEMKREIDDGLVDLLSGKTNSQKLTLLRRLVGRSFDRLLDELEFSRDARSFHSNHAMAGYYDFYLEVLHYAEDQVRSLIEHYRHQLHEERQSDMDNDSIASRVSSWRTPSRRIPSGTYHGVPWVGYAELQLLLQRFHETTSSPSDWFPSAVDIPGVFEDTTGIRPVVSQEPERLWIEGQGWVHNPEQNTANSFFFAVFCCQCLTLCACQTLDYRSSRADAI